MYPFEAAPDRPHFRPPRAAGFLRIAWIDLLFAPMRFNAAAVRFVSLHLKGMNMNLPVETKPALWGIAGGAIALAIIGLTWGGWVTGARATADATQRANTAVVVALAPVCVERFKGTAEVSANLAALKLVDSWSQGAYVEKGGWAALPGSNSPEQLSAVARACAALLTGA